MIMMMMKMVVVVVVMIMMELLSDAYALYQKNEILISAFFSTGKSLVG